MGHRIRILAGTALGVVMSAAASAAAPAAPHSALPQAAPSHDAGALILLAQSGAATTAEELRRLLNEGQITQEEYDQRLLELMQPAEEAPAEEPAAEEAPAEEAPAEQAPAQEAPVDQAPAEEAPAEEAPAEAAPPAQEAPAEPPAVEEAPPAAEEPAPAEEAPVEEPPAEQVPAAEEPPLEEEAPEAPAEQPSGAAPEPAEEPAAEQPAEEPAPPTQEAPASDATQPDAPTDQPAAEEPAPAAPAEQDAPAEEEEAPPADAAPAEEAPPADEPAAEQPATSEPVQEAPAPQEVQPTGEPAPADEAEQPAQEAEQPAEEAEQPTEAQQPATETPVLDSQKEAVEDQPDSTRPNRRQPAEAEAAPPPESDAAAQSEEITPAEIQSITEEEGQRIEIEAVTEEQRAAEEQLSREERRARREARREARQERREERRERRENAEVVEQFDDNRVIIEFNNQVFIESPDYERIILDEDEVFYEELSDGRIREVIIRPNEVRVVTIRNRYGDIVRRSKIFPDGREVVLVYVPDRYYDEVVEFRDPAEFLPPLRLTIPVSEYILEAETVEDPDRYYTFLEQPPVAEIERTYSIEEVKRSARVRDTMRRIDLDTINFEFGSAEITESEIDEIEAIAEAILRMLEENPGETFLIEGHTDAVGTEVANLALSDRRAEAVARALTNVFGIPPENLVTQGYGEQYLKVATEEPERENRRVALRRITPLVAPVASNQ